MITLKTMIPVTVQDDKVVIERTFFFFMGEVVHYRSFREVVAS